jgi:murein DD-endopeptidase MepM/ murein hydrolase activator NlpD
MPGGRGLYRAVGGGRGVVVLLGILLVGVGVEVEVERFRARTREVRWLRARLSEKTAVIAQQRREMSEVAAAVERVVHTAGPVRDRGAQVRRMAHMEESRETEVSLPPSVVTRDDTPSSSPESARSLEGLAWIEGQVASLGDTVALLTAVLKDHPQRTSVVPSLWPVHGVVTSDFGPRSSPYGRGGYETHPGIDIQAPYGTPVLATGAGEVTFAGRDPGYGALVVIDHGRDIETLYGHLAAIYVREGQQVKSGEVVGAVGATGRVTGVHLHYEVRLREEPVDPMRYLDGGRAVRNASSPLTSVRPAAIDVSRHASARFVGP